MPSSNIFCEHLLSVMPVEATATGLNQGKTAGRIPIKTFTSEQGSRVNCLAQSGKRPQLFSQLPSSLSLLTYPTIESIAREKDVSQTSTG